MIRQPNRRELLASSLAAASATALANVTRTAERNSTRNRLARFAHLTDVHVQTERSGDLGFATALKHLQDQADPPEFIIFGGDNVMNVDSAAGADNAEQQLATWKRTLKNELSLPYHIVIGNHDVFRNQAQDGKKWAMDAYGLNQRYQSIDQSGWRMILLDSTFPLESGYRAELDEAQFDWLKTTIKDCDPKKPILIASHIPILGACPYFDGDNEKSGNWVVPGAWMHIDARKIKELFRQHPNVRLAISGHIHLVDHVTYNEVSYYCNGAVSGGWWKGNCQEFGPGYALIDLYDDGSTERQFVFYPWQPKA